MAHGGSAGASAVAGAEKSAAVDELKFSFLRARRAELERIRPRLGLSRWDLNGLLVGGFFAFLLLAATAENCLFFVLGEFCLLLLWSLRGLRDAPPLWAALGANFYLLLVAALYAGLGAPRAGRPALAVQSIFFILLVGSNSHLAACAAVDLKAPPGPGFLLHVFSLREFSAFLLGFLSLLLAVLLAVRLYSLAYILFVVLLFAGVARFRLAPLAAMPTGRPTGAQPDKTPHRGQVGRPAGPARAGPYFPVVHNLITLIFLVITVLIFVFSLGGGNLLSLKNQQHFVRTMARVYGPEAAAKSNRIKILTVFAMLALVAQAAVHVGLVVFFFAPSPSLADWLFNRKLLLAAPVRPCGAPSAQSGWETAVLAVDAAGFVVTRTVLNAPNAHGAPHWGALGPWYLGLQAEWLAAGRRSLLFFPRARHPVDMLRGDFLACLADTLRGYCAALFGALRNLQVPPRADGPTVAPPTDGPTSAPAAPARTEPAGPEAPECTPPGPGAPVWPNTPLSIPSEFLSARGETDAPPAPTDAPATPTHAPAPPGRVRKLAEFFDSLPRAELAPAADNSPERPTASVGGCFDWAEGPKDVKNTSPVGETPRTPLAAPEAPQAAEEWAPPVPVGSTVPAPPAGPPGFRLEFATRVAGPHALSRRFAASRAARPGGAKRLSLPVAQANGYEHFLRLGRGQVAPQGPPGPDSTGACAAPAAAGAAAPPGPPSPHAALHAAGAQVGSSEPASPATAARVASIMDELEREINLFH